MPQKILMSPFFSQLDREFIFSMKVIFSWTTSHFCAMER